MVGCVRKQDMVKIGMDSFVLAGPIRPELELEVLSQRGGIRRAGSGVK